MTQRSSPLSAGMVLAGRATPGSPCGDIHVSEALIAQRGPAYVHRMVRETFDAAHRTRGRAGTTPVRND